MSLRFARVHETQPRQTQTDNEFSIF